MSDMVWLLQAVYSTVLCATVVLTAMGVATATTDATIIKQLNETIAKVQTSENPNSRSDAAEHLAQLTRKVDPKEVDDKTLADLVSLLDTWEDSVRDSVAISLGNLGPRARVAAPALLEILPEVDCLWVDASSAHDVRNALKRIGVTPPPPPTCETTVDPVVWNQRMRETIAKARTSETPVARAKAAAHLSYLTFWLGAKGIDDKNIADLVSLLDTPEEPVREAVVGSLGYIGSRARMAVPKLEELLPEVDCREPSLELAKRIRAALGQMGVKQLPAKCGTLGD
jgi:HEAT repeat protein